MVNYRQLRALIGFVIVLVGCGGCGQPRTVVKFTGATMGTQYSVTVVATRRVARDEIERNIARELAMVVESMSTYEQNSELSRLNRDPSLDWIPLSAPLYEVMAAAQEVASASNGAFDVSVGSLVNAWGFGPEREPPQRVPDADSIARARAKVGLQSYALRASPPAIRKRVAAVNIDLSAIAKGYAVDRLAIMLESQGIADYLVDIGGELRASGTNSRGSVWRIGIENPTLQHPTLACTTKLDRQAMATSGNYRNYFEQDGVRYGHTLVPSTGQPTQHRLLSVTVVHQSAMLADAWATALMSMGPALGPPLARSQGLAALFLRDDGDELGNILTKPFECAVIDN